MFLDSSHTFMFWSSLVSHLVKNRLQCGRPGFNPWVGKIPWRRECLPTPVFWPGEFHGLYSPQGGKESTQLSDFYSLHFVFICTSSIPLFTLNSICVFLMYGQYPRRWVIDRLTWLCDFGNCVSSCMTLAAASVSHTFWGFLRAKSICQEESNAADDQELDLLQMEVLQPLNLPTPLLEECEKWLCASALVSWQRYKQLKMIGSTG